MHLTTKRKSQNADKEFRSMMRFSQAPSWWLYMIRRSEHGMKWRLSMVEDPSESLDNGFLVVGRIFWKKWRFWNTAIA